jgi:hypothetical protein
MGLSRCSNGSTLLSLAQQYSSPFHYW